MKNLHLSNFSKLFLSFVMMSVFAVSSFAMSPRHSKQGYNQEHYRQHIVNCCCNSKRYYKQHETMAKRPRIVERHNGLDLIFVFVSNI